MADLTLADLAEKMREIDIAFLTTTTDDGSLASRPMSNNKDVDYDGASHYFTYEESRTVADIEANDKVQLSFMSDESFYVTVAGSAELVRDKAAFQEHWVPDLEDWFEEGVDTPGLVLIKVTAERVKYWDGMEDGEITGF